MRSILNKIFLRKLGPGKFFISGIAFLTGLCLVLISLQVYIKINEIIAPKKHTSNYIILNKEVGMGHTLFGGKASFSSKDIEKLRKQDFVEELGMFNASHFQVKAYAGGDLGFYTELFFESVPHSFIDNKPYNFKWDRSSDFLPLIVSQDFLNLYNFGYALGRGTPQLSKSTIGLVPLKIEISGAKGRQIFNARVVGFSERIPSVLVPEEFLKWANQSIGGSSTEYNTRAIIKVKGDQSTSMEKFLEENNFRIGEDKIQFSRIISMIHIVMIVLLLTGSSFIVFSLTIIMLNFSLIVAEAKEEISLLIQLGYKSMYLVKYLSSYLFIFIITVSVFSSAIFYVANQYLISFLIEKGMDIGADVEVNVILLGMLFVLIAYVVSFISIFFVVKKHS